MPTVSFKKNHPPLEVPIGSNLMKVLLDSGLPVASSCLGDGICGKCKIIVLEGGDKLSPENDQEKLLREKYQLASYLRVSCQTQVLGNVTVDATYW